MIKTLTLCTSNVFIFTRHLSLTVNVSCKCIEIGRKGFIRRKAWMLNPTDYNISIVNLYQTETDKNMIYKKGQNQEAKYFIQLNKLGSNILENEII